MSADCHELAWLDGKDLTNKPVTKEDVLAQIDAHIAWIRGQIDESNTSIRTYQSWIRMAEENNATMREWLKMALRDRWEVENGSQH